MFYSYDLLCLRKGRFGPIWIAATRGPANLNRRDISSVDIDSICKELLEYIQFRREKRLSLYLTSQLSYGITVIYKRKCMYLLADLQELYSKSFYSFRPMNVDLPDPGAGQKKAITLPDELPNELAVGTLTGIYEEFGEYEKYVSESIILPNLNNTTETSADPSGTQTSQNITLLDDVPQHPRSGEFGMIFFGEELQPLNPDCPMLFTKPPSKVPPKSMERAVVGLPPSVLENTVPTIDKTIPVEATVSEESVIETVREQQENQQHFQSKTLDSTNIKEQTIMSAVDVTTGPIAETPLEPADIIKGKAKTSHQVNTAPVPSLQFNETALVHSEQHHTLIDSNQAQEEINLPQDPPQEVIKSVDLGVPIPEGDAPAIGNHQPPVEIDLEAPQRVSIQPILDQVVRADAAPPVRARRKLIIDTQIRMEMAELRQDQLEAGTRLKPRGTLLAIPTSKDLRRRTLHSTNRHLTLPGRWESGWGQLGELWTENRVLLSCYDDFVADNDPEMMRDASQSSNREGGRLARSSSSIIHSARRSDTLGALSNPSPSILPEVTPLPCQTTPKASASPRLAQEDSQLAATRRNLDPIFESEEVRPSTSLSNRGGITADNLQRQNEVNLTFPQQGLSENEQVIAEQEFKHLPEQNPVLPESEQPIMELEQHQLQQDQPVPEIEQPVPEIEQPLPGQYPRTQHVPPQPLFKNEKAVCRRLQEAINESGRSKVTFHVICPIKSLKSDACLVFATLLQLAKTGKVLLEQSQPFAAIYVTLVKK